MAIPWSTTSARNLGQVARQAGLCERAPRVDQLLPRVPVVPVDGYEVEYPVLDDENRPDVAWVSSPGGAYQATAEAVPDPENQSREMRVVEGAFQIPLPHQDAFSSLNDLVALQVEMKRRAILQELGRQIFQGRGDQTPGLPLGVDYVLDQLDPSQKVDAGGQPLAYDQVTEMLMLVQANHGQAHYIVGNRDVIKAYVVAVRSEGLPPELVEVDGLDRPVLAHLGVPILRNDLIQNTYGPNLYGRLYAVVLGGEEGLRLCIPRETAPTGITVRTTTRPDTSNAFGRVAMSLAVVVPSDKAVAAVDAIQVGVA